MFKNPLEQFDITFIFYVYQNFVVTNFSFMILIIFFTVGFLFKSFRSIFIFNSIEFIVNYLFLYVISNLKDNLYIKKYSFIFLFYFLFLFILISNLIGMTPYVINIFFFIFKCKI